MKLELFFIIMFHTRILLSVGGDNILEAVELAINESCHLSCLLILENKMLYFSVLVCY